jgi:SAM-dependent methyltransferase
VISLKSIWLSLERLLLGRERSDRLWWQRRAARRGVRAVLNLGHSANEIDAVTAQQEAILFPLLRAQLNGSEKLALDFGCGPGRFTRTLADTINGRAIGVDLIQRFLDLAPPAANVEYRLLEHGRVPVENHTIDVVFVCLTLGAITERSALQKTLAELERVSNSNALFFIAENTTVRPDMPHIIYRSVDDYQQLFDFADIRQVGDYQDLGETISVLAGRRRA